MQKRIILNANRASSILNSHRIALYGGIYLFFVLGFLINYLFLGDPKRPNVDFLVFYSASELAWRGEISAIFNWDLMRATQAALLGLDVASITGWLGWHNPPHFLFAVYPLSSLDYAWAWLFWILVQSLVLALAIRSIMPGVAPVVAALATPSILACISVGQNGVLTAAFLAWALALHDRRPLLAGIALGFLTMKPQFGLVFPLLLVLTGRWRVFVAAAVTTLLLVLCSILAFGAEAWRDFFLVLPHSSDIYFAPGADTGTKIQSVLALMRALTGNLPLAVISHVAVAGIALAVTLRLWMRRPEACEEVRAASAIACAFLLTPYVWTYDTPAIAIAVLFLARAGRRDGFLAWERPLLILACAVFAVALFRPYPAIGPSAWSLVLALAWRRDRAWRLNPATRAIPS